MSNAINIESLGPPRGRTGRYQIDMGRLLTLYAEGYSPRQIGEAFHVSAVTVSRRIREHTKTPPDPRRVAMGKAGSLGRKRTLARRKREAKAAAERQKAADAQMELIKFGLLAMVTDRLTGVPKPTPPEGWNAP